MQTQSRQIYVPVDSETVDPLIAFEPLVGQINPNVKGQIMQMHGRTLGGLGGNEQPYDAEFQTLNLRDLEHDDDVYGSGVFDTYGHEGTVHTDLGVFADHPSLPGYVRREVQFAVSPEIADITSGADVVVVPAGGMTYQEKEGREVGFDQSSCVPRPIRKPTIAPGVEQVYVSLTPHQAAQSRGLAPIPAPAPTTPFSPVPYTNPLGPVGRRYIANLGVRPMPTGTVATTAGAPVFFPPGTLSAGVRSVATATPELQRSVASAVKTSLSGMDETTSSYVKFAVGGTLVGIGLAALFGAMKPKKPRGRR